MGSFLATTADHDRVCLVPTAEEKVTVPSLSVALVSADGSLPPSLSPIFPRVTETVSGVRATDDVVICYGPCPVADVVRLRRAMGNHMPAVLVAARGFDPRDVITAFDHGATSYLVVSERPEFCLAGAALSTARGESCLSPAVATALLRHVYPTPLVAPGPPVADGVLTPRERQIMELLVTGHTISEIAGHLRRTRKTVRNNLSNIYAKLQVRGQSEAILLWLGHEPQPRAAEAGSPHRLPGFAGRLR